MQILDTVTSTLRGRMKSFAQNFDQPKKQGREVNRWVIYKQLCVAKSAFDLNDRCLAVLSSLLSFLPDDHMSEKNDLVVFPSNHQLSLRAHGMPESTLRRHLASLVEARIIARKDSPTRKRYAHKDREGEIELAFGFSFAPLLNRASEISAVADQIISDQKALKRLRDEVSVIRRDNAAAFADNTDVSGNLCASLQELFVRFRNIVNTIPRRASFDELTGIKATLEAIGDEIAISLKNIENASKMSGSVAQSERQHIESLPESLFESSNAKNIDLKVPSPESPIYAKLETNNQRQFSYSVSLDQVLRACPDISEYGTNGITTWRDLHETSRMISGFLGISHSAYQEAIACMGMENASITIAWILQKVSTINSPGGYLRSLTQKARGRAFSISRLLFSEMKAKQVLGPV